MRAPFKGYICYGICNAAGAARLYSARRRVIADTHLYTRAELGNSRARERVFFHRELGYSSAGAGVIEWEIIGKDARGRCEINPRARVKCAHSDTR